MKYRTSQYLTICLRITLVITTAHVLTNLPNYPYLVDINYQNKFTYIVTLWLLETLPGRLLVQIHPPIIFNSFNASRKDANRDADCRPAEFLFLYLLRYLKKLQFWPHWKPYELISGWNSNFYSLLPIMGGRVCRKFSNPWEV